MSRSPADDAFDPIRVEPQAWFLVGPSNVGKTSALDLVDVDGWETVDLDRHAQNTATPSESWEALVTSWDWVCGVLDSVDREQKLVAIGAGSQALAPLEGWLEPRRRRVIVIDAESQSICNRTDRDFADFQAVERSAQRTSIYEIAAHRLDVTGLTRQSVADLVAEIVFGSVPRRARPT